MEKWVKRVGDRVFLTKGHEDDGLYELLRRIEQLENDLEVEQMRYRNLELKCHELERKYLIAKKWNKCTEEEVTDALLQCVQ